MLTSQLVGNLTLASLNTPLYSPTLTPNIWSLGTPPSLAQQEIYDLQSNVSLQVSRGQTGGYPLASGLGIIHPSGQAGLQDDLQLTQRLDVGHDSFYRHHTSMHTEAINESVNPSFLEEPSLETFALSVFLNPQGYYQEEYHPANEEPVIERKGPPATTAAVLEPTIEEQGKWVLQQILEASGHTIESLAAEVSAGLGDAAPLGRGSYDHSAGLQSNSAHLQNAFFRFHDSPLLGVNPADIMPSQLDPETLLPPSSESPLASTNIRDFGTENKTCLNVKAVKTIVSQGSPPTPVPLTEQNLRRLEEITYSCKKEISDYEPSLSFSASSTESAFRLGFPKHKARVKLGGSTKARSGKQGLALPLNMTTQSPMNGPNTYAPSDLPINYGTPVLDAHRGIELTELKAKAERYRMRNQCQEYDKKWLLSFAGKLTTHGQLTEEYRCYVIGCNQSNRRRDHILIHVGGHLDQRPFACTHCSARFLRKNECKRHELSHTGARPFTCDMCPFGTTTFVRQDLLKRHQNRTHNLNTSRGRTAKRHRRS